MRNTIFIFTLIIFGCQTQKNLYREYTKKSTDFEWQLILNNDSTFSYSEKYFESNPQCTGKFHVVKNIIYLICNEQKFPVTISNGYLKAREMKVRILSQRRIKMDKVVLIATSNERL